MKRKKKGKRTPPVQRRRINSFALLLILGIILAVAFTILATTQREFLQDDAYISFRYALNFLNGDGLVFNSGERVEGYTNFLWVIILIGAAKSGFTMVDTARWLGIIFTAGTVTLTVLLTGRLLAKRSLAWWSLGAAGTGIWVAVNPALHYWGVAGLETALFLFLVTFGVERLLARSSLSWPLMALATLTRPEGGLVFIICAAWYLYQDLSKLWPRVLIPAVLYIVPLLPFAAFKLFYYGSIFPNPFYAKTGFSPEYWRSGIEYLWLHLEHFALWGVLVLPVIFVLLTKGPRSRAGLLALLWLLYTLYIVSIGGDVLRAHRFFVPIWPVFAVVNTVALVSLFAKLRTSLIGLILVGVLLLGAAVYQWRYSAEYFRTSRRLELGIVYKMNEVAYKLKLSDQSNFSIAASTIGKLGYDLMGHTLIDMLGLTDSTIARHPEKIEGMETTWKERHFNAGYVLSRDPDYILFSTGYKPSAPAERALVLHSKFRQNYFVSLYPSRRLNRNLAVYKRIGEFNKPDSVWPDLQLANDLNDGLNLELQGKHDEARAKFRRVIEEGPGDFAAPYNHLALSYVRAGDFDRGIAWADSALEHNPYAVSALTAKYDAYRALGDSAMMTAVMQDIIGVCPWIFRP